MGIAAHDGHEAVGINFLRLADDFAAFLIGILRHRAGVDNKDIGLLVEFHALVALLLHHPGEGRGFREIQLAAKRIECHFFHN